MGSHLRFGFEATYGRDTVSMRDDNVADYPWLCFALMTVMQEYERLAAAGADDEDTRAGGRGAAERPVGRRARVRRRSRPRRCRASEADRGEFASCSSSTATTCSPTFERYRPSADSYSPLAFFFNFSHNVLKGTVVDALLRGRAVAADLRRHADRPVARPASEPALKVELARTLMGYARANPDTIRGRPMPVIVYDPDAGSRAFSVMLGKLQE